MYGHCYSQLVNNSSFASERFVGVKLSLALPECDPDGVGLLGRLVRLGSCGLEQEQVGPQHHGKTSKTVK